MGGDIKVNPGMRSSRMKRFTSLLAGTAALFFLVAAITGLFAGCGSDSQNHKNPFTPMVKVIDTSGVPTVIDSSGIPTVIDSSSQ
jgi:hypothetical protein